MELRQLRSFLVLAETLHFTRAAERLGIAQPALSQQMRQLEGKLGVSLLYRTKRHVALTDAGAAFLKEAQRTLAQADHAVAVAQRVRHGEIGELTIGFEGVVAYELLPRILVAYRARYPLVHLTLMQTPGAAALTASLVTGQIDAGFVCPDVRDTALHYETAVREGYCAVMPESHPLAHEPTVSLAALTAEQFVLFPRHCGVTAYDQIIGMCVRTGFTPHVAQEASRYTTIVALVGAGMGVSLVPACVGAFSRAGVVFRPLADAPDVLERCVVWRRDAHAEVLEAFLAVVREVCLPVC